MGFPTFYDNAQFILHELVGIPELQSEINMSRLDMSRLILVSRALFVE